MRWECGPPPLELSAIFAKMPRPASLYNTSMATPITEKPTLATLLSGRLEQTGAKLQQLAEAYPAEQYEVAPAAGIRTFAATLRHVAFWNLYLAQAARGAAPDGSANELPASETPDKPSLLRALAASTAEAAAAVGTLPANFDPEKAELAAGIVEHICEHYGQLAVYARWAGIIPPASRG